MNVDASRAPSAHLITLAADDEAGLRALAADYAARIERDIDAPLADTAWASNARHAEGRFRAGVVVGAAGDPETRAEACAALGEVAEGRTPRGAAFAEISASPPRIAFLFTGQGAQYGGMGRALYETDAVYRDALDGCAAALDGRVDPPLLDVMHADDGAGGLLDQTAYTQPSLFALECGLAALWRSWGVVPDVTLGHSVGELAAACFAGAFTLDDGIRLIAERGRLIQSLPAGGAMAAVFAEPAAVEEVLEPFAGRAVLATMNGPAVQVISGEGEAVAEASGAFKARGIKARSLTVSHAFHSPLMEPILEPFMRVAEATAFRPIERALALNRDGRLAPPGTVLDAAYWRDHIRNPVQFDAGMRTLAERGCDVFLEIGPANTLVGMGQRCVDIPGAAWLTSLGKGGDPRRTLLASLAQIYARGAKVDWAAVNGNRDTPARDS